MEFLNSLQKRSKQYKTPFDHWELKEPLTQEAINEICKTEITNLSNMNIDYDGTRAVDGGKGNFREGISNGGKAIKFRCFIEKKNSTEFPHLSKLIKELTSKDTCSYIGNLIKKDLSNSYVRVEVICDRQGFWLKPHCDIKEKLISCLLFANPFHESESLGTDLYKLNGEKLDKIKTVPYKNNYGYFFTSGPNTWHGMEKKKIKKERRCLQINYVTFKTDWKVQV
tara:strand:+ start:553 stop:1227 length:675 start_codon:yes stop_codon:yes gene_type:complete